MRTQGGEKVELHLSNTGQFGRLDVSLLRKGQSAFMTADQLRELARQCEAMAAHLDATSFDRLPPDEQRREIAATTDALKRALDTVAPRDQG